MKINDKRSSIRKHATKRPSTRSLFHITQIIVHHSLTKTGSAEAFANYHIGTNGWSVMGYTYVINKDGTIDWCADYTVVTPHVGNHNKRSLGICLVGDFRTEKPTDAQYKSLLWLIDYVQEKLPNNCAIKGHSELSGYSWKQCPVISMDQVRKDVSNFTSNSSVSVNTSTILKLGDKGEQVKLLQEKLNSLGYNCGIADGIFGNATDTAVKSLQRDYKLTVDGIVGEQTLEVLDKEERLMKEAIAKLEKRVAELEKQLSSKKDTQISSWAEEAYKWAVEQKISDGTQPKADVTREQLWTMLHRTSKLK